MFRDQKNESNEERKKKNVARDCRHGIERKQSTYTRQSISFVIAFLVLCDISVNMLLSTHLRGIFFFLWRAKIIRVVMLYELK